MEADARVTEVVSWQELDYAMLSMLWRRPDYGYRLRAQLRSRLEAWELAPPASESGVYHALGRLRRTGLIEQLPQRGDAADHDGPHSVRRALYELTDEGRRALRDHLARPLPLLPAPNEFYLRLLCTAGAAPDGLDDLAAVLDGWEQRCLQRIRSAGAPPGPGEQTPHRVVEQLRFYDTSLRLQVQLDWIAAAREAVERIRAMA